ncbi:hypothetical protein E3N88_31610 [Mikania micrantha]|uniref:Uncharacterized protein n=1 Tax=Mikania micrantha TaxID=192012 RepID=A0A5N6M788_9ASTR|nr:hypothetical protein E3N88_31610 [Mikania micrantha]
MENKDLELGDMENMIQERVQRFIHRVEKEHSLNEQITPSIHMAPHTLRDVSPQSFSPRVVSIGSLHRDDENVQAFERQKATYLINLMTYKAGVKFKPNRSKTWVLGMEMEFPWFLWSWCKCTLRMPVLNVHDSTESILRNLIAYELESKQTRKYITSYAFVMDILVNTEDDVAKLVDSKVLVNIMGSNEEAANMINNICKHVSVVDLFHTQQWKTLDKYSNNYWPKHIAWMRRTYFSSPWNIIALFVGSILFALTMVQTIFTINEGNK